MSAHGSEVALTVAIVEGNRSLLIQPMGKTLPQNESVCVETSINADPFEVSCGALMHLQVVEHSGFHRLAVS